MSLFSPADIDEFRLMQADLAFSDHYRLQRTEVVSTDTRGNRVTEYVVVESGYGRVRNTGLQSEEQVIADRLGWTNAYAIDLPWETMAVAEDRVLIQDRVFHIGVINREQELGMNPVALCDERSH